MDKRIYLMPMIYRAADIYMRVCMISAYCKKIASTSIENSALLVYVREFSGHCIVISLYYTIVLWSPRNYWFLITSNHQIIYIYIYIYITH